MRFSGFVLVGLMAIALSPTIALSESDLKHCQEAEKVTNTCCVSDDSSSCMNAEQKAKMAKFEKLKTGRAPAMAIQKSSVEMNEIHHAVCHTAISECAARCSGFPEMAAKCSNYSDRLQYFQKLKTSQ